MTTQPNQFGEIKEHLYNGLIKELFRMRRRMRDRDQTVMLVFPYDNLEEYFNDHSGLFIVAFSKADMFFAAVFRNYIKAQLQCITRGNDGRDQLFEFEDFIRGIIDENLEELKQLLLQQQPYLYRAIEELHEQNVRMWHPEEVAA